MFGEISNEDLWALSLSLLAGLSTSVGGVLAVIKRPDEGLLAFLLGIAIGVMASLSVLEMYVRNALEHGFVYVTISVVLGAAAFYFANPYFPEFDPASLTGEQPKDDKLDKQQSPKKAKAANSDVESAEVSKVKSTDDSTSSMVNTGGQMAVQRGSLKRTVSAGQGKLSNGAEGLGRGAGQIPPAELLRLGLLMAVTMTIHNCPEGFAVAFAANTEMGVMLTTAIAIHNIPEGIIVAAPVYAATGNRWMAVGIATVSGLSEPLGALVALLFIRPFLSSDFLNYMIGFVGGIMLAVCIVELWPEARKCQSDIKLGQGCVLGAVVMLWTLHMGV